MLPMALSPILLRQMPSERTAQLCWSLPSAAHRRAVLTYYDTQMYRVKEPLIFIKVADEMITYLAEAERVHHSVSQLHRHQQLGAHRHRTGRAEPALGVGGVHFEGGATGGAQRPAAARTDDIRCRRDRLARVGACSCSLFVIRVSI